MPTARRSRRHLPSGYQRNYRSRDGRRDPTPMRPLPFFRRKPAHLAVAGRIHCGPRPRRRHPAIEAGVLAEIRPQTFENVPRFWRPVVSGAAVDGHKYARGHVIAVSGDIAATVLRGVGARGVAGGRLATCLRPGTRSR